MSPQPGDAVCPAWAGAVPLGLPSGIPAPTPRPFTLTSSMPGSSGSSALRGARGCPGTAQTLPQTSRGGWEARSSEHRSVSRNPRRDPSPVGTRLCWGVDRGIPPSHCRDRDQGPGAGSERECGHETLGGSGKASWRRREESEERQKGKGGHSRERGNSVGNH